MDRWVKKNMKRKADRYKEFLLAQRDEPLITEGVIDGKLYKIEPQMTWEEIEKIMKDNSNNPWSTSIPPSGSIVDSEGKRRYIGGGVTFPDPRKNCPDCLGTGEYRGLSTIEPCETCKGLGQI